VEGRGGAIKLRELFAAVDHRREVVCEEAGLFARPKTGEDKDRLADARLADGDAFFRASDAKPIRAGLFEGLGDLRPAMAIAVALDDAKDFPRPFAAFFQRIHEFADGVKVLGKRRQGDLSPHGAAFEMRNALASRLRPEKRTT